MKTRILLPFLFLLSLVFAQANDGPIRVLFLGHNSKHHPSNEYYPLIAKALGQDAIYFDYTTSVEEALGNAKYLGKFDVLLLYANHGTINLTSGRI